jgi:hypothetical protein
MPGFIEAFVAGSQIRHQREDQELEKEELKARLSFLKSQEDLAKATETRLRTNQEFNQGIQTLAALSQAGGVAGGGAVNIGGFDVGVGQQDVRGRRLEDLRFAAESEGLITGAREVALAPGREAERGFRREERIAGQEFEEQRDVFRFGAEQQLQGERLAQERIIEGERQDLRLRLDANDTLRQAQRLNVQLEIAERQFPGDLDSIFGQLGDFEPEVPPTLPPGNGGQPTEVQWDALMNKYRTTIANSAAGTDMPPDILENTAANWSEKVLLKQGYDMSRGFLQQAPAPAPRETAAAHEVGAELPTVEGGGEAAVSTAGGGIPDEALDDIIDVIVPEARTARGKENRERAKIVLSRILAGLGGEIGNIIEIANQTPGLGETAERRIARGREEARRLRGAQ